MLGRIYQIFRWYFGPNDFFKKTFWNYLTFRRRMAGLRDIFSATTYCYFLLPLTLHLIVLLNLLFMALFFTMGRSPSWSPHKLSIYTVCTKKRKEMWKSKHWNNSLFCLWKIARAFFFLDVGVIFLHFFFLWSGCVYFTSERKPPLIINSWLRLQKLLTANSNHLFVLQKKLGKKD